MMHRFFSLSAATVFIIAGSAGLAKADTEWVEIKDPAALQELISGKLVDGKYWIQYYREDGNMAFYSDEYKSMSIRKWKIEDDGRICTAVYAKPERSLGCFVIQQSAEDSNAFRMVTSAFTSAFTTGKPPPENLVEALNETAGPMK